MDIQTLQAFIAVADTGSFSQAAARLHLTQPAISKRVAALETNLDVRLFDRIGRSVQLTEAGRTLLPRARRILLELEDSRRALSRLGTQVSGPLRIGTSHHIGLHRLPPLLRDYCRRYPLVELDIAFLASESACEAVEHGELELAVITLPNAPPPALRSQMLWRDPLAVVVAQDHPLAQRTQVEAAELRREACILPPADTYTRQLIEAGLGAPLRPRLSPRDMESIRMLVGIGLGWGVIPHTLLDQPGLALLTVPGVALQRPLGAVLHRERSLSQAGIALLTLLESAQAQAADGPAAG